MKFLLPAKFLAGAFLIAAFALPARADIQAPPMSQMGPTRKLGRGISNILYGVSEIPVTMCEVNEKEGNAAGWSYGIVKGVGRAIFRIGAGFYDVITFPAPCYKSSYRPPYEANTPWKLNQYSEFPPELGWESRFNYSTLR